MENKKEIERKFIVSGDGWKGQSDGLLYRQGYLLCPTCTLRLRIVGENAFFTIKGMRQGISRLELEYKIPVNDAQLVLKEFCTGTLIEKIRYRILYGGNFWEVDVFKKENKGLILAEIELKSEDEIFEKPDWLGREVSMDKRYTNSMLSQQPYCTWENLKND